MNRKDAEKLAFEVRKVLINDWDPIAVNSNPNLQDEYDNYIGGIIRKLLNQTSNEELVDYLYGLEKDYICCFTNQEIRYNVARKLRNIEFF